MTTRTAVTSPHIEIPHIVTLARVAAFLVLILIPLSFFGMQLSVITSSGELLLPLWLVIKGVNVESGKNVLVNLPDMALDLCCP